MEGHHEVEGWGEGVPEERGELGTEGKGGVGRRRGGWVAGWLRLSRSGMLSVPRGRIPSNTQNTNMCGKLLLTRTITPNHKHLPQQRRRVEKKSGSGHWCIKALETILFINYGYSLSDYYKSSGRE